MVDLISSRIGKSPLHRGLAVILLLVSTAGGACRGDTPEAAPSPAPTPEPAPSVPTPIEAQPSPGVVPDVPTRPPDAAGGSLLRDAGSATAAFDRLARLHEPDILEIDYLVSRGEVREITGYLGGLRRTELEGQTPDEDYNAFRLASDEGYGFGLQVWKFRNENLAASHFNRLRETYVVIDSTRVAGNSAFWAELGGIRQLVIHSRQSNTVVSLSCDEEVCPDETMLLDLADRIVARL